MQYLPVLKGVLITPKSFFVGFKGEVNQETIGKSVVFILVMSLIGGAIAALLGIAFPAPLGGKWIALAAVVFYPLAAIIGSFISAGIVWAICRILGAKPSYQVVFALMAALAAFMPLSALFSRVLAVSFAISIWSFVSFVFGVTGTLEVKPVRAWITFGSLAVVLMAVSFAAMKASQKLVLEAQRQAEQGTLALPTEGTLAPTAPAATGASQGVTAQDAGDQQPPAAPTKK